MALSHTPLRLELALVHVDRGIHEDVVISTARHPSETTERVWLRILAYVWQWRPELVFGDALSDPDVPDLSASDATGSITAMVFVGKPEPRRVLKVRSRAPQAATAILFESPTRLAGFREAAAGEGLTARLADVECAAVESDLLRALAPWDERRMRLSVTFADDVFYLDRDGADVSGALQRG